MATIEPTVGRSLHYMPSFEDCLKMPAVEGTPLACILAGVQDNAYINLCVFDMNGTSHSMTTVRLCQDGEAVPEEGGYACWMPYQVGQAKTTSNAAESAALIKGIAKL